MFRSEKMALCQMFIQPEAAYATASALGEAGTVQFIDLNKNISSYNRRFVAEVRLCDEMERRLRYLHTVLTKEGVSILNHDYSRINTPTSLRYIQALEASIEADETRILDPSNNFSELQLRHSKLSENLLVLQRASEIFTNEPINDSRPPSPAQSVHSDEEYSVGDTGFVTGVIQKQRLPAFERMIWRVSHGYGVVRTLDVDDTNEVIHSDKTIFGLYFQGASTQSHILTICRGFHAKIYNYPIEKNERLQLQISLQRQLSDLKTIIDETQNHRRLLLENIAENWMKRKTVITKMKAVYHVLNYFNLDVSSNCFICECWIPKKEIRNVEKILIENSSECDVMSFLNIINTSQIPPTYYRSNKFTKAFQSLTDTYGCCSYREVNPAFLSIITFPFLFGVMFGDIGHGLILLLFALYAIFNEKKLEAAKDGNEIWNLFFFGRYIILLMGIFSMYTGLIYNDIFSKSFNMFGSGWNVNYNISEVLEFKEMTMDPAYQQRGTYPMGLDPIWQLAHNKILFSNSYKMKLSIIIGVLHMLCGVALSVFNHVHFHKKRNILIEFIPRLIFLLAIFGYLCVLLFLKWILYSAKSTDSRYTPFCAPSVLVTFINMVLMQKPKVQNQCAATMYNGQLVLQRILLISALLCVPIMLLMEPMLIIIPKWWTRIKVVVRNHTARIRFRRNFYFWRNNQEDASEIDPLLPCTSDSSVNYIHSDEERREETKLSDIFILQAIHTIEFVLSTVSHTASYLRLWALSLAHSQLSEVLWSQIISNTSQARGPFAAVFLWAAFAAWATLTVAVLVLMEGLSAFLHTLRLHWVEFMSKFYTGDGYNFRPFCFRSILEDNYS